MQNKSDIRSRFSVFLAQVGVSDPEVRRRLEEQLSPVIEAAATTKDGEVNALADSDLIKWPTETYKFSKEAGRGGAGIIAYLERVWARLIAAEMVDLPTLRRVDRSAATAIQNFLKREDPKTGERCQLPAHLHIPTLKEINNRLLARNKISLEFAARLQSAARRRSRQPGS